MITTSKLTMLEENHLDKKRSALIGQGDEIYAQFDDEMSPIPPPGAILTTEDLIRRQQEEDDTSDLATSYYCNR